MRKYDVLIIFALLCSKVLYKPLCGNNFVGSGSGGGMLFNFLGDEAEDEEVQSEASSDEEEDEAMDTTESQTGRFPEHI